MTPTQPPAPSGKISDERLRELRDLSILSRTTTKSEGKELYAAIDELLSHRHPAPVADERAEVEDGDVEADTGHAEADRVIRRLASSDPDFSDCTDAAVLIRRLVVDMRGPDGFPTWKDAAIAEKLRANALSAQPSGALDEEFNRRGDEIDQLLEENAQLRKAAPPPERAPGGDAIPNCGCREAGCPHTPVVQLSREELVATYKARIRDLEKKLEAEICRPPSSSPSATADATLRAALEKDALMTEAVHLLRGWRRTFEEGRHGNSPINSTREWLSRFDAALAGNEGKGK